jgi:hypothetical protein
VKPCGFAPLRDPGMHLASALQAEGHDFGPGTVGEEFKDSTGDSTTSLPPRVPHESAGSTKRFPPYRRTVNGRNLAVRKQTNTYGGRAPRRLASALCDALRAVVIVAR